MPFIQVRKKKFIIMQYMLKSHYKHNIKRNTVISLRRVPGAIATYSLHLIHLSYSTGLRPYYGRRNQPVLLLKCSESKIDPTI